MLAAVVVKIFFSLIFGAFCWVVGVGAMNHRFLRDCDKEQGDALFYVNGKLCGNFR